MELTPCGARGCFVLLLSSSMHLSVSFPSLGINLLTDFKHILIGFTFGSFSVSPSPRQHSVRRIIKQPALTLKYQVATASSQQTPYCSSQDKHAKHCMSFPAVPPAGHRVLTARKQILHGCKLANLSPTSATKHHILVHLVAQALLFYFSLGNITKLSFFHTCSWQVTRASSTPEKVFSLQ